MLGRSIVAVASTEPGVGVALEPVQTVTAAREAELAGPTAQQVRCARRAIQNALGRDGDSLALTGHAFDSQDSLIHFFVDDESGVRQPLTAKCIVHDGLVVATTTGARLAAAVT
jgi:hypothetical protein